MNKLTKETLKKTKWGAILYPRIGLNYENMHGTGFSMAMLNALEELYEKQGKEVVAEKMNQYLTYYNTNPVLHPFILGSCVAIEESGEQNATETSLALRSGLMGPFAGIGDSLFFMNLGVIFNSLAGYMAQNGSMLGVWLCVAAGCVIYALRFGLFNLGYMQGVEFVNKNQAKFKALTNAMLVLGFVVIGAMIPSIVKVTLKVVYSYGDATLAFNDVLNNIIPNLLPTLATVAIYFALGIKKMTTVKMVWLLIGVSILLSLIGIL